MSKKAPEVHPGSGLKPGTHVRLPVIEGELTYEYRCECSKDRGEWWVGNWRIGADDDLYEVTPIGFADLYVERK